MPRFLLLHKVAELHCIAGAKSEVAKLPLCKILPKHQKAQLANTAYAPVLVHLNFSQRIFSIAKLRGFTIDKRVGVKSKLLNFSSQPEASCKLRDDLQTQKGGIVLFERDPTQSNEFVVYHISVSN